MRRLYDLAETLERDPRVASISIFAGFPYADIPDAGLGIYVVTHDDRALAERLADDIARVAWEHRHEFLHRALPVREAVTKALAAEGRPIVLADMADNTGGGAAGDGTEILRELVRVGARSAVVACLWDPAAVGVCAAAGVGARVTLDVGGKIDDRHGAPLRVTGTVRTLSDGRFVHKGPMMRGLPGRLGTTAVLDVDDVKVILISYRWQTLDPEMIRFVGIDPLGRKGGGGEVHYSLPRGVRADREGDHRSGRARPLVLQPRALRIPAHPPADLSPGSGHDIPLKETRALHAVDGVRVFVRRAG
jgi:microcystin degradation protein MlrC